MADCYRALLYYGVENDWDNGDVYHAFELVDPAADVDEEEIARMLAEWMDCTPDDERFACKSMYVRLPETLVARIQADAIHRSRLWDLDKQIRALVSARGDQKCKE